MGHYDDIAERLADQFKAYQSEWYEEPRQADLKSAHGTWEEAARAAHQGAAGRTPFVGQESTGRWWKMLPGGRWALVADKSGAQDAAHAVISKLHRPGRFPDVEAIAEAAYLRGMNAANHGVPQPDPGFQEYSKTPPAPSEQEGK